MFPPGMAEKRDGFSGLKRNKRDRKLSVKEHLPEKTINQDKRSEECIFLHFLLQRKEGFYDIAQRGNIMEPDLGSCFVPSVLLCRSQKTRRDTGSFSREGTG